MSDKARAWLRWLAPLVVIAVLLIALRDELPFLGEAWALLVDAPLPPIITAIITANLALVAMSAVMQILLNVDGRIANPANTNAIVYASNAWSTTVPGGPALSALLTFRVHRSWGASVGLCGWFFVISGALSTVWMALIGVFAVLFLGADLNPVTLAASLAAAGLAMWAVFWATRNPDVLKRLTRGRGAAFFDQLAAIRIPRTNFAAAAGFSLLNRLFDLCTLTLAVSAVGGLSGTPLSAVALAYIMTKLAGAAQITPGGVGTVEPVLAGMLVAGGLSLVDATAATAIYRAISFAMITTIGWVVYALVYMGRVGISPRD